MAGKLIDLVPRAEELTQIDSPRTSSAMRALVSAVLQLRSATAAVAEAQDTANGNWLRVEAALSRLEDRFDRREDSSADLLASARGPLREAIRRGMSEEENRRADALEARAKIRREQMLVLATIGGAGWPVLAALAWGLWYLWHHLS